MKSIVSPPLHRAHRSGTRFGKVATISASLLAIATLLFVGSRDWKAGRSPIASLLDISNIKSLFTDVENAGGSSAELSDALEQADNEIERSLIQKGTLIRRSSQLDEASPPPGLTRPVANR